jgi:hypothetical protein
VSVAPDACLGLRLGKRYGSIGFLDTLHHDSRSALAVIPIATCAIPSTGRQVPSALQARNDAVVRIAAPRADRDTACEVAKLVRSVTRGSGTLLHERHRLKCCYRPHSASCDPRYAVSAGGLGIHTSRHVPRGGFGRPERMSRMSREASSPPAAPSPTHARRSISLVAVEGRAGWIAVSRTGVEETPLGASARDSKMSAALTAFAMRAERVAEASDAVISITAVSGTTCAET